MASNRSLAMMVAGNGMWKIVSLHQKSLIFGSFTTDIYNNMHMIFFISSGCISIQRNFLPFSRFFSAFLFVFSHNNWNTSSSKKCPKISPGGGFPTLRGGWTPGVRRRQNLSGLGTPSSGSPRLFHLVPCGERLRSAASPEPSDWPLPLPLSLSLPPTLPLALSVPLPLPLSIPFHGCSSSLKVEEKNIQLSHTLHSTNKAWYIYK